MKVTRSYWLGLGSGLILSAMLMLIISPKQGQAVIPQKPSSASPLKQQAATSQPVAEGTKQVEPPVVAQPSVSTQLSQGLPPNTSSPTQSEQEFIIPKGASSERITDLLVAQGLIKDGPSFLIVAHQMGVDTQFRAGTFILSKGLTSEEVIHRLMK